MKRILLVGLLLVGGIIGYSVRFGLPISAEKVVINQPEYSARHVLLRVYAGPETEETRWILLGTNHGDTRVVVKAPPARGIYTTPGFSSVRHDRPFTIQIDRRVLGFMWVPDQIVAFNVSTSAMPMFTQDSREKFTADFEAALGELEL